MRILRHGSEHVFLYHLTRILYLIFLFSPILLPMRELREKKNQEKPNRRYASISHTTSPFTQEPTGWVNRSCKMVHMFGQNSSLQWLTYCSTKVEVVEEIKSSFSSLFVFATCAAVVRGRHLTAILKRLLYRYKRQYKVFTLPVYIPAF